MTDTKIGLALSGGGARGYAHVGVLKALVESDIPIDFISGCSAGSFVGAAFAAGMSVDDIIEVGKKISWFAISSFSYSPRGLLTNAPLTKLISDHFPVTRFEELTIPFAAVACDLETGNEIVLRDHGDVVEAIRASCAIPGVFVPVIDEQGRSLIDGGVVSPMPTKIVRKMGADVVIAVDLIACGSTYWGKPSTLLGMFFQSAMMMLRTTTRNQHYHADIVIQPPISHIRPDEIAKRDELIELGYRAAVEKLDAIRSLVEAKSPVLT